MRSSRNGIITGSRPVPSPSGGGPATPCCDEATQGRETYSLEYLHVISGTGGVTIAPDCTATLTLSASNTYTGQTTVNSGVLTFSGSAAEFRSSLKSEPFFFSAANAFLRPGWSWTSRRR